MERYELVIRFLQEIGAARDAAMYVRLFQKEEPSRFAVIEVGEDLTPVSLHILALNLSYLAALDLYPVVVHAGVATASKGRRARTRGGRRDRALAVNETLITAIEVQDGMSEGVVTGVFSGPVTTPQVRLSRIRSAVAADAVPIVAALSVPFRLRKKKRVRMEEMEPIPLRAATAALVRKLKPRKIILLNESGGLRRADGSILDYVNLRMDRDRLLSQDLLSEAARAELGEAEQFLAALPPRAMLQIASPASILRELFTQRGGGTLVKRGRELVVHEGLAGISRDRIRGLIERSFGRRLARDYFISRAARRAPIQSLIVDPDYKGVAIVRSLEGLAYLDKFAVRPEARGEGIATDLWCILIARHPELFWRSRPDNPINGWYWEQADGCVKHPEWWLWWKGLSDPDARRAVKLALAIPPTLE